MSIYYVNGEFVSAEAATLNVRDLSVLRGYGTFDYLRTYGGQPFRLTRNIARLRRSCEIIALQLHWSDEEFEQIVLETLRRNEGISEEFSIRMVVTGGISTTNILPDGEPSLIVMVEPLSPYPAEWYKTGVKVIITDEQRLYPAAKSIAYLPAVVAQQRAKAVGGIEALYRTPEGHITEGTTSNVFALFSNTLVTPAEEILPGITREAILELATPHYTVEVRSLSEAELLSADEVFITAANKRVLPVVQVDDTVIGDGTPGESTRHIMALFDEFTGIHATGQ